MAFHHGKWGLRVGLVQMRMDSVPEKNLARAIKLIGEAAKKGAKIACLPELFTSTYFAQQRGIAGKYAEEIPGKTTRALSEAARKNKIILVAGSIYEKSGGKFYNSSVVFGADGQTLGVYRKIHIPHDDLYWEKDYFAPGDQGFKVFQTPYCKIGVLICYDQWFPEAARINALMGADIIFYPTAIGNVKGITQSEGNWQKAWENVMRGHAIANGVCVCGVNRAGREERITFWGGSFACDAFGTTRKRAGKSEEVLIADINLDLGKAVKEGWGFMRNRRPECYSLLTKGN